MGFLSGLSKLASAGVKAANDFNQSTHEAQANMEYLSDAEVVRKARNGTFAEKAAAARILRDRGYDTEEKRKELYKRYL